MTARWTARGVAGYWAPIAGWCVAGACSAAEVTTLWSDRVVPARDTERLLAARPSCSLLKAHEFLSWADTQIQKGQAFDPGLYWLRASDPAERGYALYMHLPARQVVEYGNLVFDAFLVARCDVAVEPRR